MEIRDMIKELERRRAQLTCTIEHLEALDIAPEAKTTTPGRRGRKSMGAAERLVVAARMRKYWAARRKSKGATSE